MAFWLTRALQAEGRQDVLKSSERRVTVRLRASPNSAGVMPAALGPHKALSPGAHPGFETVVKLVCALGLQLTAVPR